MKKFLFIISLLAMVVFGSGFYTGKRSITPVDSLRMIYNTSPEKWPKPLVDAGVKWTELSALPRRQPVGVKDTARISLGKVLFYDPRLSGSNQISCINCHAVEIHWADGRETALGHDNKRNSRNTPSLENIASVDMLFWDGRAKGLEDQFEGPIASDIEMHQNLKKLPAKLARIKGYKRLFASAYGDEKINLERVARALADYERTLVSRKSDFDYFMEGTGKRLNDQELRGLHLFRTKGRCMNCHYGPYFTDNDFHNLGLTYYGRARYEDLGRYNITKKPEDVGRFKTPSLRNVMHTGPWFHNGLFGNMQGVLNMYNAGMARPKPRPDQLNDPLFPKTDVLLRPLGLTKDERDDIIAFLGAITTQPWKIQPPVIPQ